MNSKLKNEAGFYLLEGGGRLRGELACTSEYTGSQVILTHTNLRLSCTCSGSFSPGQQTLVSKESVCDTTATRTQKCLKTTLRRLKVDKFTGHANNLQMACKQLPRMHL